MRYLIGVDEAGRAPLAGPVAVGAARVRSGFNWSAVGSVRDSKKMTPLAREDFFTKMLALRRAGDLQFTVVYASHTDIDAYGIARAVHRTIAQALKKLGADPAESHIFLDGLLHAPEEFRHQQTIIGGDDVLPIISVAAVAAKVSRDRLMRRLAQQYPAYGFDIHKGYPTKRHYEAIGFYGLSPVHRRTYCTGVTKGGVTKDRPW